MKKNTMMRLASFLLIAVLITTSAISGTYAKYVTQDSASDSARVAKWGISLQVVGDLYSNDYYSKSGTVTKADTDDSFSVVAQDAARENVVAPGTKNDEGMSFGLTGTPEVDYQIDATIKAQNIYLMKGDYGVMVPVEAGKITDENFPSKTGEKVDYYLYTEAGGVFTKATAFDANAAYYTLEDLVELNQDYYPVVYKMAGNTNVNSGTDGADSLNAIAAKIAEQLNDAALTKVTDESVTGYKVAEDAVTTYKVVGKTYDSNVAVDNLALANMAITWEWAFETSDMKNGADTILGNLMAGAALEGTVVKLGDTIKAPVVAKDGELNDYCLDTQFSIDITVTQVN